MFMVLDTFTVCFFGHRKIDTVVDVENKVYEIVGNLIRNKESVEFLVGRNGDFDRIVSSTIIQAKKNIFEANSFHNLILPYPTAEYSNNVKSFESYYDNIEICDSNAYFKAAFQKRNRNMIDRANLCVFYVLQSYGGAYQAMKYAIANGSRTQYAVCTLFTAH